MDMTLRWYGADMDSVTLEQIRQIPGVTGVITSLHDIPAGEPWTYEDVMKRKKEVEEKGLKLIGIESINVHEDIKIGLPTRDKYIENYKEALRAVGKADIHLVCYNFMPVFDWTRTDLALPLEDGSNALAYDSKMIDGIQASEMFERIEKASGGFVMPGWEPNRKDEIMDLFDKYKGITAEKLMENLKYFLDGIMPVCEEYKIKMAIHPDDPAWSVFGLPRIVTSEEALEKIASLNPSIYNGFTICTGSLGSNLNNDLPKIIRNPKISERIHFAHIRNIKYESEGFFHESSHLSSDGDLDMYEIVKALSDIGFDGVIRPDHGRMIWNEQARPGYGLYDRALGVAYLNGLWEAIKKNNK
ncbi:MAG: mannonate dehydratase [Lachnospiraceae bacterium]|nr:mannonate dehydratase [Lachnospiraceae bacterium]